MRAHAAMDMSPIEFEQRHGLSVRHACTLLLAGAAVAPVALYINVGGMPPCIRVACRSMSSRAVSSGRHALGHAIVCAWSVSATSDAVACQRCSGCLLQTAVSRRTVLLTRLVSTATCVHVVAGRCSCCACCVVHKRWRDAAFHPSRVSEHVTTCGFQRPSCAGACYCVCLFVAVTSDAVACQRCSGCLPQSVVSPRTMLLTRLVSTAIACVWSNCTLVRVCWLGC